jgi:hypothetical protein
MPEDGHWLASFEAIQYPRPKSKKKKVVIFPRPKQLKKSLNPSLDAHPLLKKISGTPIFFFFFFGCFCRKFCHADLDALANNKRSNCNYRLI